MHAILYTVILVTVLVTVDAEQHSQVYFEWSYINFTWPSTAVLKWALFTQSYIPFNSVFTGVKHYKDKIFLSLPRIRNGTPVTLAYIAKSSPVKRDVLLTPFPSFALNTQKNCWSLQDVQSMEIDKDGIMWVLDGRRTGDVDYYDCPAKIILYDLNRNKIVQSYDIPESICLLRSCFLNDIVVDDIDGGYAYISESGTGIPGIIVYSKVHNRAWKVVDPSMLAVPAYSYFYAQGLLFGRNVPVDGIALSPAVRPNDPSRKVFFSSISGLDTYVINSDILRNEASAKGNVSSHIKVIGRRPGQTDGMMFDSQGNLFYGLLPLDGIGIWNVNSGSSFENTEVIDQNAELIKWPDTFAFDNDDLSLLVTSNDLNSFTNRGISANAINFRLLKYYIGTKSYQYGYSN